MSALKIKMTTPDGWSFLIHKLIYPILNIVMHQRHFQTQSLVGYRLFRLNL